jgi:hypothetical protein
VIAPLLRTLPLPPGVPKLPLPVLVALSLINPVLYLAAATALGAALAPRLGLVSHVVTRVETGSALAPHLRREAPLALTLGLTLAAVTVLLDKVFQPYLGTAWAQATSRIEATGNLGALVSGLLYGGITEGIMLRWGVLSLFAWAGWRVLQRDRGSPGPVLMGRPPSWPHSSSDSGTCLRLPLWCR